MPYRPKNKKTLRPPFRIPGGYRFLNGHKLQLTKGLIKRLENQEVLTDMQNYLVEEHMKTLPETINPAYVARLLVLSEKPVVKAEVDKLGNPVDNKVEEKIEEQDEQNEQTTSEGVSNSYLHLDVNNRLEDKTAVLRQMARYAVKNNIDEVYILGDVYERKRPYNSEKVIFEKFVKYLSDKGIEVIILAGNHDTDKDGISAVEEFKILQLPHIKLLSNPSLVTFAEHKLLLGHFLINGAKLGPDDYSAGRAVNLKDIIKAYKADLYLFGDVHKAQKLKDNPPALYVGSPERNTFGERRELKGFTLLESTLEKGLSYKFIPLKTRPMVQYNVESPKKWLHRYLKSSPEKAIIKVKISCTKEEYKDINEDEIRKKLKGAESIKIEYNILKDKRIRNEKINESRDTSDAFKNYAEHAELDDETIELGLKIIKEVK